MRPERPRRALAAVASGPVAADVTDGDGVRHRLWVVPDEGEGSPAATLIAAAAGGPVFIADGHHRYETATRYRDERRQGSAEQDPAFDFVLMLFLEAAGPLTVLPTHRVVRGLGDDGVATLMARLPELFDLATCPPTDLVARFEAAAGLAGGEGRFGLRTREGAWLLEARREAFAQLAVGDTHGAAVRALDVSLFALALERLAGIDAAAVAGGDRITYSKAAADAAALVETRRGWCRCRLPARAHARRLDPRGRPRRRRDAPEVDLLLSQGPDRARAQPARVVGEGS